MLKGGDVCRCRAEEKKKIRQGHSFTFTDNISTNFTPSQKTPPYLLRCCFLVVATNRVEIGMYMTVKKSLVQQGRQLEKRRRALINNTMVQHFF
mmetsp:Transcript_34543/g.40400  ORF Transcript_34543/g.40400 Transcript_34543/m.40400 type:complete len:94 (-) Transcript_34543:845-1126(-)